MAVIKSVLILISLALITACGGGGGSSSSNNNTGSGTEPKPATLTLINHSVPKTLIENESNSLVFTVEGVEGALSISVEHDYLPAGSSIETMIDGAIVTVNIDVANELMHNSVSSLTVTIEDDRTSANQAVNWTGKLSITNTSGDKTYERYVAQKSAAQAYALMIPEQMLVERLIKLAELVNEKSNTNVRTSLLNRINDAANNAGFAEELTLAIETLDEYTSKYIADEINENELFNIQTLLESALNHYSSAAYFVIKDAIKETAGIVSNYEYQGAIFSDADAKFSSFIGNSSLGAYENENWVFTNEYAFLEPVTYPETETCDAE